jgi:glucokinase
MARAAAEAGRANMTGREVMAAASGGDRVCAAIVRRSAQSLGLAIANAANVIDPDTIVLGGGVPEAGDVWLAPLREAFMAHAVSPVGAATRPVVAELGYRAGVLGAAALGMALAGVKGSFAADD